MKTTVKIRLDNRRWQWAVLFFLAVIWGSSFILMKKGLQSYTNTQVAAFRMLFSFVFMLPFSLRSIRILTRENIGWLAIVGLAGFAVPALLFTTAQKHIDSSLAGMLNSLTPMFTMVIGLSMFSSKVKPLNALGIFIGLVGAIGLIWKRNINILDGINIYALLVVAATICYGINVNVVKYKLAEMSPVDISAVAFLFVGPAAGLYLLFSDFSGVSHTDHHLINLVFIAVLALFSSVLAVIIFNALIKFTTTIFAVSVTYIIPLFAIIWGLFDGEKVSFIHLMWMGVIMTGLYLVNKGEG